MFGLLSVRARKLCMPSESCAPTAWTTSLQFRSVVIAKLMYASSAWWDFAGASNRQRLAAFIRRSDRSRFVPANLPAFADLCHDAVEKMFAAITRDRHHVLHHLLPPQSAGSQNYNLRQRTHTFALPSRYVYLTDNNFIQRMLYFDVYYRILLCILTH